MTQIRIETVQVPRGHGPGAAERIHDYWLNRPRTFWLDSSCNVTRLGRFSFLGTDPWATLTADGETVTYATHWDGSRRTSGWSGDPLRALAEVVEPVFAVPFPSGFAAPFAGGLVGYMAYDLGHRLAGLPLRARRDLVLPEMAFGFYDAFVCIDHLEEQLYIVSTGLPLSGSAAVRRADQRLEWLRHEVERALAVGVASPISPETWRRNKGGQRGMWSTFTREAYLQRVEQVLALIHAGEIEQVNLSQRFTVPTEASPHELYRRLRRVSPAPYAGLLQVGDAWILSSSPERFLHIRDDHIEMRPIKGTRPRSSDPATDSRNREALLTSAKDAAEHDMIVAMERAALEQMCQVGTVHVPERMVCEEYETVFHLVSTVAGRLPPGADRLRCIRNLFPAGSITGCSKLRAMELIDELEPVRRGVYTGSIGYFGVGGNVDLNVAIRTLILQGGYAHFHAGGAIVADSSPDDEYEETLDKAKGIMRALLAPTP